MKWVMAVPTTGSGCARARGVCRPRCPYFSSQRRPRGRCSSSLLCAARETPGRGWGTRAMLRGFGRTRVPRRLRVTLEWGWLPGSLPAPQLRTLCPQPGPPRPPGIGRGARPMERRLLPLSGSRASWPMAARRARRSLPRVPAPGPALTPPGTSAPLLPAGQRAAAAPPRRLGASQPPRFSSTPRHP